MDGHLILNVGNELKCFKNTVQAKQNTSGHHTSKGDPKATFEMIPYGPRCMSAFPKPLLQQRQPKPILYSRASNENYEL